jgi:hypothetical protein
MLSQLRSAYLRQDYLAACNHLTKGAQREIGLIGHGEPSVCDQDMKRHMSSTVLSKADLVTPRLEGLRFNGDRATGRASIGDEEPIEVRFARDEGTWKLATLFAAVPRRQAVSQSTNASIASSPSVRWLFKDGRTVECPHLKVRRLEAEGGCVLYALGLTTLNTLNVFGDSRYVRCPISFALHVGRDGAVALGGMVAQLSPDPVDMCGDVMACHTSLGKTVPWTGRLAADSDGRVRLALPYICLDTCLGRFVGQFDFGVDQRPGGRTALSARRVNVGDSSLFLSGRWSLEPPGGAARLAIDAS